MKTPFASSTNILNCTILVVLLAIGISFTSSCQHGNNEHEDFYFSGKDTIKLTIPPDSIPNH